MNVFSFQPFVAVLAKVPTKPPKAISMDRKGWEGENTEVMYEARPGSDRAGRSKEGGSHEGQPRAQKKKRALNCGL